MICAAGTPRNARKLKEGKYCQQMEYLAKVAKIDTRWSIFPPFLSTNRWSSLQNKIFKMASKKKILEPSDQSTEDDDDYQPG